MSVLTLPLFSSHLLRMVNCTQGLLAESEYRRCPSEDQPDLQQSYLAQCLERRSHEDLAKSVHRAWLLLRKETALLRLILALKRHNSCLELQALLRWGNCKHTASTVSSGQESKRVDAERACQRLFADAREKEQLQGVLSKMKAQRETAGCTFQPSLCSRSSVPGSRSSTPSRPKENSPLKDSAFDRLYQHGQQRLSSQRLREAEQLANETRDCTFQPQVIRSQTPQPASDRCVQLHQSHAQSLHRRRRQELNRASLELQGLTFAPALTPYQPPAQVSRDPPVRLKPRSQAVKLS